MKKISLTILVVLLLVCGLSAVAHAQENTCPVLNGSQLLQCPGSGNCVNNMSSCPVVANSSSSGGTAVGVAGGEKCSGIMIAQNTADAQNCARLAEQQGRALGYDIQCTVESTSYDMVVPASAQTQLTAAGYTGIKTADNGMIAVPVTDNIGSCRINGSPDTFDPRTLVGYSSNQPGYVVPDPIAGTRLAYGSGFTLNSMWSALPCDLANSFSGGVGGGTLTGASSCSAGAAQYFGSANPANWNATNAGKGTVTPTTGTGGSCRLTATCAVPARPTTQTSVTGTPTTNTQVSLNQFRTTDVWSYVDPYVSDAGLDPEANLGDGAVPCTGYESTAACHPEWSRSTSLCSSGNSSGSCAPERVNPYAAAAFAKRAETTAVERGVPSVCTARYVPFRPNIDPATGLNYYYDVKCSVNGAPEVAAGTMFASDFPWAQYGAKYVPPATPVVTTPAAPVILPAACALTATCNQVPAPAPVVPTGDMTFRYMKISTTKQGWVSWREIEVYDKAGVKISGVTASTDIANEDGIQIADNVLDGDKSGNANAVWNAGETNADCKANYGPTCPDSIRAASITLDLKAVKETSKISLVHNGNSLIETTTILVSNDNVTFRTLTTFTASKTVPLVDGEVMEYPFVLNPNAPAPLIAGKVINMGDITNIPINTYNNTIFVTNKNLIKSAAKSASGEATITAKANSAMNSTTAGSFQPGDQVAYLWDVANADYITISKQITVDPSLGTITQNYIGSTACGENNAYDLQMFPTTIAAANSNILRSDGLSTVALFPEDFTMPNTRSVSTMPSDCNMGKIFTTTVTAHNKKNGKTAAFKFNVKVPGVGATAQSSSSTVAAPLCSLTATCAVSN